MNSDDFARIISDNSDDLKGGGYDIRLTLVDGERIDGQPTYRATENTVTIVTGPSSRPLYVDLHHVAVVQIVAH